MSTAIDAPERARPITSGLDPRFQPALYALVGVEDGWTLEVARRRGAYEGARRALSMTPEAVQDEVKRSGLRGRGGAGFPTGVKWSFMPKTAARQHYLVCNADESEPGSFKDRYLLEQDPHQLIEGLIVGCHAIRATVGYIYIRGEYILGARRLESAIREAREAGLLGDDAMGSGVSVQLHVHRGAGAYICGEETALMNSLEGLRANPRLKPPFPAGAGVYGLPSTINNVETLCSAALVMRRGADWYTSFGTEKSKGIKLFQVSGPARRPGVYELPLGATFRELIYDWAGGPTEEIKAFNPGGSSAPLLPFTDEVLDSPMDYEAVASKGSMLGTGGVILLPRNVDIVTMMWNYVRFYAHESCGKCTPCREGIAGWMVRVFEKLVRGRGEPRDVALIADMCDNIAGKSFCLLADSCLGPVVSSLKLFRDEYEHLATKGTPKFGPLAGRWAP